MPEKVLAATTTGRRTIELREYPLPDIPQGAGLLRIEAAGVCGSDWQTYNTDKPARIMGHENVGRIDKIGPIACERWGLQEGDRVALEEYLPCGHCNFCRSGEFRLCEVTEARHPGAMRYGTTPITQPPALWGGFSQYQYLHPNSVFHRVPENVPAELLAMCLPVGNGIQWMCFDAGAGPGKSVLIQGPGQQGLACATAAKSAGADLVIVSGLDRDRERLEVAKKLGADHVVFAEREDVLQRVMDLTSGLGVDISLDAAGGPNTLVLAIRAARKNGKVLFATTSAAMSPEFSVNDLLARRLTLQPCRGHSFEAVEIAIQGIVAERFPYHLMATHRFGLAEVDLAIRSLGGEGAPGAIHVTVIPWETA